MSTTVDLNDLTEHRVLAELDAFGGNMPERYALVWHGYLAALMERGLIDPQVYKRLHDALPKIEEPNPLITLFEGRGEAA